MPPVQSAPRSVACRLHAFLLAIAASVATPVEARDPAAFDKDAAAEREAEPLYPVPVELSRSSALEKVKKLFENEYREGASDALAERLLETGKQTADDMDLRFVLLDEARNVAAKAGDLSIALEAVELIAEGFAIDVPRSKAEVFEEMRRAKLSRYGMRLFLRESLRAIDEALRRLDTEAAARLVAATSPVRRKLGSEWLSWNVEQRDRRLSLLEKHIDEYRAALRRLNERLGDAAATSTVGKFLCLAADDWETGLEVLRSGGESRLRKLLELELKPSSSPPRLQRLGDAWWTLSEDEPPFFRDAMRRRGYQWHLESRNGLAGVAKLEIEKVLHRAPERHLTDMQESEARIGWDGVLRRDDIVVDGLESKRGLYPHAKEWDYCLLKYNLDKQFNRFETCVALRDTATNPSGPFFFEVLGDGRRLWLSREIRGRRESQHCSVSVSSVNVLELRVHCKGSARQGHTAWLDPVVRR